MMQIAQPDFGNSVFRYTDANEASFTSLRRWTTTESLMPPPSELGGRSLHASHEMTAGPDAVSFATASHFIRGPGVSDFGAGLGQQTPTDSDGVDCVSFDSRMAPWSAQDIHNDPLYGFRVSMQSGKLNTLVDSLTGRLSQINVLNNGSSEHDSNSTMNSDSGSYNNNSNSNNNNNNNNSSPEGSRSSGNSNNNSHENNSRHKRRSFHGLSNHRSSLSPPSSMDSNSTGDIRRGEATTPLTTSWNSVMQSHARPSSRQRYRQNVPASSSSSPPPPKNLTVTLEACCATPKLKVTCGCCSEEARVKAMEELKPRVIPVSTSQLGFCRFCQTNGDPPEVYQSHTLRSGDGRVSCPVLREYNCPICHNGGGDFAHTIKYCPMARKVKPNN